MNVSGPVGEEPRGDFAQVAVCANCGAPALTTAQFVAAARDLGLTVDPISGAAAYASAAPFVSTPAGLPMTEAEKQLQYDAIQGRRGFVCMACGNIHCASCLAQSPASTTVFGPSCPSCSKGPHELLEG